MRDLTGDERLKRAGLDLDLPRLEPQADEGEPTRFCAYTGREQLLVSEGERSGATARLGIDSFTTRGEILRYRPGGGGATPVALPTVAGELRGTVDLLASSGQPLACDAVRYGAPGEAIDRFQLAAPQMGTVREVVARHGRLFALISYTEQQHVIQAWRLPGGETAAGWRPPRLSGALAPFEEHRAGSALRVSETLCYLNFVDRLAAWHTGTGAHLVDWPWPPRGNLPAVRIAFHRVLLLRENNGIQTAELHDLERVAGGIDRPLSGLQLGEAAGARPQPLWAEAADDRFVVLSADGRVFAFPFDGEPVELFPNVEAVRLGPPAFRRDETGRLALVAYAGNERGRWLLEVPLDGQTPYRFVAQIAGEPAVSQQLAPCWAAERWYQVEAGTEQNVRILRAAAGTVDRPERHQEIPGTGGARVHSFGVVYAGGQPLIQVEYGQNIRRHWLGTTDLEPIDLNPPWPQLRDEGDLRRVWDASGLCLCDLTDGVAYPRRVSS